MVNGLKTSAVSVLLLGFVGGGRFFAHLLESLGHGGGRREAAALGYEEQFGLGFGLNEPDSHLYAVSVDHVVERLIAAAVDDFGQVLGVDVHLREEALDGDVLFGNDGLVGQECLQFVPELLVPLVIEAIDGMRLLRQHLLLGGREHLAPGVESEDAEPDTYHGKQVL